MKHLPASLAAFAALFLAGPEPALPAGPRAAREAAPEALPQDWPGLRERAERLYRQGSYALAHELYQRADAMDLEPEAARWVDFRVADTLWRAEAGGERSDDEALQRARRALEELVAAARREDERDQVWAEAQESLGDFHWTRRDARDWGGAWPHYGAALGWWAASTDIDRARERYLAIVWKTARDAHESWHWGWNVHTPRQILENAVRIARAPGDAARAHFLLATALRNQGGDWRSAKLVARSFEAAIEAGSEQEWYDDALYFYAQWLESSGRPVRAEGGGWRQEPDYAAALALYRRLMEEFSPGESRWRDDAQRRAEQILAPQLGLGVSNVFLPGSEVAAQLSWRNVQRVELALFPVDLLRDVDLSGEDRLTTAFLESVDLAALEPIASWSVETGAAGDHRFGSKEVRIERDLELGAYVLRASGGGKEARELVLVTDAALVLKTSPDRALAWFVDARTGEPIGGAAVRMWERWHDGNRWRARATRGTGGEEGVASFDLADPSRHAELFVAARLGGRTAFAFGNARGAGRESEWRIQAFTDRPAYRPEDTVRWKVLARRFDGSRYSTPAGARVAWKLRDPHGSEVAEGEAELNAFGSAWGELELSEAMALGEYGIELRDPAADKGIGRATLFRLEEYKLPEFQVAVRAPQVDGERATYRLGDTVEVEIEAEYYSGGPVAGAAVEVVVEQHPFHVVHRRPVEFPWLEDSGRSTAPRHWGGGTVVARESLRTDARGVARLRFATPFEVSSDFEYRIEARVTDASRREVVSSDSVRVTRQGYYVFAWPRHNLHRPGDTVEVELAAVDANQEPVSAEGLVTVWRERWVELWIDPSGEDVPFDEVRTRLGAEATSGEPPPGWRIKTSGYQRERVVAREVSIGKDGEGLFSFQPEREGAYRVAWSSRDGAGVPIEAETMVWVASDRTTELAWRRGELEIVVDKESFRAGEDAFVMLSSATSGGWVLFAVEGERLHSWQVVHLEGTAKLLRVPLDDRHVPNAFLSAEKVRGGEVWIDVEEITVPPLAQVLEVTVEPDGAEARPGEEGTFTVTVRDHEGEPVSAEVSLSVVDESVFAIQEPYAEDPRRFFHGRRRPRRIGDASSFAWRPYARLVEAEGGGLRDARAGGLEVAEREQRSGEARRYGGRSDVAAPSSGRGREVGADDFFLGAGEGRESLTKLGYADASAPQEQAPGAGGVQVAVRADFRATALWEPALETGDDGRATVRFRYPESLTRWRATARAATSGTQVGLGEGSARTNLPLMVRLQAPRFFVVGDLAAVSAVIQNRTGAAMVVGPSMLRNGREIVDIGPRGERHDEPGPVTVPANGEVRVDWYTRFVEPGEVTLRATARGEEQADAMERAYRVHEHGILKLVAASGKLYGAGDAPDGGYTVRIDVPAERREGSTRLVVQVAPSLAVTMVDALPYLLDYPYGCTEQTMSRFLPAAIVAKTLRELGLDPAEAMERAFGGIEGEFLAKTHPKGARSLALLDEITSQSLRRLYDFQHSGGGWGWWKEGDSDPYMSAYVLWGLALAREAGIDVSLDAARRGAEYLDRELVEAEAQPDLAAWMLHALAEHRLAEGGRGEMSRFQSEAFERLWEHRDRLNAYTRALFALAAHGFGRREQALVLADNLRNGVEIDRAPDTSLVREGAQGSRTTVQPTAHWGGGRIGWRWSQNGVEATATALRALIAIRPGDDLVAPAAHWLVRNRRGAQWSSTRETAIAVLALERYLEASGELASELDYALAVNGKRIAERHVGRGDVLSAPSTFEIDPELVRGGTNEVHIERTAGSGPLYFSVEARFFSLEEPVTAAGNEVFVRREYFVLEPEETLLAGYATRRRRLRSGETVHSGQRIETVVVLEAKNDLEYLVIEDKKPAGLEAVEVKSGETLFARELRPSTLEHRLSDPGRPGEREDLTGRSRWVHQELRDRQVALFVDKLPQGVWEIRYEMRAEVPGRFHGMPVVAQAMYVPEIRGNGEEILVVVEE